MSDHKCTTSETVVALCHTCDICGNEIEPVDCPVCLGFGADWKSGVAVPCDHCKGTGVAAWKEAKL